MAGQGDEAKPALRSAFANLTYRFTDRFDVQLGARRSYGNVGVPMVYGRVASGFRPGSPNTGQGALIQASYGSDKTINYDLGLKGAFLDSRLSIDASLYHIDWKDIQITATDAEFNARDDFTLERTDFRKRFGKSAQENKQTPKANVVAF